MLLFCELVPHSNVKYVISSGVENVREADLVVFEENISSLATRLCLHFECRLFSRSRLILIEQGI